MRYSNGAMPGSYGFTGQHADAVTGLDYYGARYYDPVAGQFTSADTMLAGGLNRYAYVSGNPETLVDPSGHSQIEGLERPPYQEAPTEPPSGAPDLGKIIRGIGKAIIGIATAIALAAKTQWSGSTQGNSSQSNSSASQQPAPIYPGLTNPADDPALNQSDADKLKPPPPIVTPPGPTDTGTGSGTSSTPTPEPAPQPAAGGRMSGGFAGTADKVFKRICLPQTDGPRCAITVLLAHVQVGSALIRIAVLNQFAYVGPAGITEADIKQALVDAGVKNVDEVTILPSDPALGDHAHAENLLQRYLDIQNASAGSPTFAYLLRYGTSMAGGGACEVCQLLPMFNPTP